MYVLLKLRIAKVHQGLCVVNLREKIRDKALIQYGRVRRREETYVGKRVANMIGRRR